MPSRGQAGSPYRASVWCVFLGGQQRMGKHEGGRGGLRLHGCDGRGRDQRNGMKTLRDKGQTEGHRFTERGQEKTCTKMEASGETETQRDR